MLGKSRFSRILTLLLIAIMMVQSVGVDYATAAKVRRTSRTYTKKSSKPATPQNPVELPKPVEPQKTVKSVSSVSKYQIYYGTMTDKIVDDMIKNYDLVILDSKYIKPEYVKRLKDGGVLTYGYVSLSDVAKNDLDFTKRLTDNDYVKVNGKKVYSGYADNYMGDIRQANYQNALLAILKERVINKGFDGVFLDTPEYYEDINIVKTQQNVDALTQGCVNFIKKIKSTYPNLSLFQNRGFEILDMGSKDVVDALLYECYDATKASSTYQKRNAKINSSGVQYFAHTYLSNSIHKSTAEAMGWKFLATLQSDDYVVYK